MTSPEELGFDDHFRSASTTLDLGPGHPARVARVERKQVWALGLGEPTWIPVRGATRFAGVEDLPKLTVGDWVWLSPGPHPAVEAVLPRKSCLVRKRAHRRSEAQPIAANVDVVFVVTTVGRDLNLARLERYVSAVREAGARPLVVVNKTDQPHDRGDVERIEAELEGVGVLRASGLGGDGMDAIRRAVPPGSTAAFVGSSGVGKSTLINRFSSRWDLATGEVRSGDEKGRHTTTHRELLLAPSGALLIDNPGVREFGLWEAEEGVAETFGDVEALVTGCRFSDCGHQTEPGCAVRAAVEAGELDRGRLARYLRLQRELAAEAERSAAAPARNGKRRWKQVHQGKRARQGFERKHGLKPNPDG